MKKKELAKKVGLDFNEIDSILSEDTLKRLSKDEKMRLTGGATWNDSACQASGCQIPQDNLCKLK